MRKNYSITLIKRKLSVEQIEHIENHIALAYQWGLDFDENDKWSINDDGLTLELTSDTYTFRMYDFLENINALSAVLTGGSF